MTTDQCEGLERIEPIVITPQEIYEAATGINHSDALISPIEEVAIALRKWLERQIEGFLEDADFSTQHLDRQFFVETLSHGSRKKVSPLPLASEPESEAV